MHLTPCKCNLAAISTWASLHSNMELQFVQAPENMSEPNFTKFVAKTKNMDNGFWKDRSENYRKIYFREMTCFFRIYKSTTCEFNLVQ